MRGVPGDGGVGENIKGTIKSQQGGIEEMILQNILFPSIDTCTEELMYFRKEGNVDYTWCDDKIMIGKNAAVTFDTYFNAFTAEKWFKYTKINDVKLKLVLQGSVRVTLMRKEKNVDGIITEYVEEQYFCSEEPKEFCIEFATNRVDGMYCFKLFGVKGKSSFWGGHYFSDIPNEYINFVKVGIDICTYKREWYIKRNLEKLSERFLENTESYMYDKIEIFISDNAHTLNEKELASDKIHIYQNKNVGGAGGFTRGMLEIRKMQTAKNITHILVMDDDVCIEPEAIFRTCALLASLKEEYSDAFIGGAMLRLDQKYKQAESGALWNAGEILSLKAGLDLRELDACLYNEFEETPQFNAWWYCAFPINIVTKCNLPVPIFIRGDDVEYGLRNMKHLILMNGICIWHEAFENKYSSFIYYYILRNRLIDNAIHNIVMPKESFKRLMYVWIMNEVRIYRYKNANLIMRGVEDFCRGIEWLASQDGEKLHQSVVAEGYKMEDIKDLNAVQFRYSLWEASLNAKPATGFISRVITHFTLNGHYLSTKRDYNIVPTIGVQQSSVYRVQKVLNYDYSSKKGFVTEKNIDEAKKCVKRMKFLMRKMDSEYEAAAKSFADNADKLMTVEFWNKYLDINQS